MEELHSPALVVHLLVEERLLLEHHANLQHRNAAQVQQGRQ